VKRLALAVLIFTVALVGINHAGTQRAGACSAPRTRPERVIFVGKAISAAPTAKDPATESEPEEWTFRVEPPVEGLGSTVIVSIRRGSGPGLDASCTLDAPALKVGRTYRVLAGRYDDGSLGINSIEGAYSESKSLVASGKSIAPFVIAVIVASGVAGAALAVRRAERRRGNAATPPS
jgi:hypothetical protein